VFHEFISLLIVDKKIIAKQEKFEQPFLENSRGILENSNIREVFFMVYH